MPFARILACTNTATFRGCRIPADKLPQGFDSPQVRNRFLWSALHRSTCRPVYCAQHCNLSADCPPQLSKVVSHPAPEPAKLDKAAATAPSEHKHANEVEFFFSANARCRHVRDTGLWLCPSSSPWSQHQDPNEDDDGIMRCQQICLHAGTTAADTALTAAEQALVSLANRSEASASKSACSSGAEHQRRWRVQVGGYGRGYKYVYDDR